MEQIMGRAGRKVRKLSLVRQIGQGMRQTDTTANSGHP
jgi:hypothetical protein